MNKRKEKRKKEGKIFAKSRFSAADEPQNKKKRQYEKKEFCQILEAAGSGINGIMIDLRECGLKQTSF